MMYVANFYKENLVKKEIYAELKTVYWDLLFYTVSSTIRPNIFLRKKKNIFYLKKLEILIVSNFLTL